ncbi:unnamed protein product [Diatraea saccharalis]|uniref:Zinc finger BED domain-containing protein 5 n=1 Tax=Diatraea saccharalis TaxID=40085 RepID=A0A9N9R9B0_9NEOP|nr:unnamed protein product [Diatraea saccharalis]
MNSDTTGPDNAKKIDAVQLSNNTISKRISSISDTVENELIRRLKSSEFFSLQLDESSDVAGLAALLVFVRYPFAMQIEEELLMSEVLETYTTGDEIFKVIDQFIQKNGLKWSKCVDIAVMKRPQWLEKARERCLGLSKWQKTPPAATVLSIDIPWRQERCHKI